MKNMEKHGRNMEKHGKTWKNMEKHGIHVFLNSGPEPELNSGPGPELNSGPGRFVPLSSVEFRRVCVGFT